MPNSKLDKKSSVCLGVIIGAHGISGDVKVKSFTETPNDIFNYGELLDITFDKRFTVKHWKQHKDDILIVKFAEIKNRNDAELLKSTLLYINRKSLPKINEEDSWYHDDLININVLDVNNNKVGTIKAIYNFGAGDILEISNINETKTELLAFTKENVPDININKGYIIINTNTFKG